MLQYSFSTIFTALLASNLLLILISVCFRYKKIMLCIRYQLLAIFLTLTLLRFILPIEFSFTTNIILPHILSVIVFWIRHPFYNIIGIDISLWTLFVIVWICGFFINFLRNLKSHLKIHYLITIYGNEITDREPYKSILDKICYEKSKHNIFRVIELPDIEIPRLYGIYRPYILIPASNFLSEEELYYVFCHETTHYFHYDLLFKYIINFITMFYWWNPACHMLSLQFDIILEMRVDNKLTSGNSEITKKYLACLIHIAESATKNISNYKNFTVSFCQENNILTKRFNMLLNKNKNGNQILNILILLLTVNIFILSYLYIFEARYFPLSIERISFSVSEDNTYFIQNDNGSYDIYLNQLYIETIATLEYYPHGIKIYNKKGDFLYEN